jgi:hypothetical protein
MNPASFRQEMLVASNLPFSPGGETRSCQHLLTSPIIINETSSNHIINSLGRKLPLIIVGFSKLSILSSTILFFPTLRYTYSY